MEINVIFIQHTIAYSQTGKMLLFFRKDDNFVETKIDKQIKPVVGIAAIANLFETMSKTPVR